MPVRRIAFTSWPLLLALIVTTLGAVAHAAPPLLVPPGTVTTALGASGSKIRINEDYQLTWEFDKTPAMGPLVLKVRLFDKNGERTTALTLLGSSDMPSMRGAHYTGEKPFRVSKKGEYLLPVDVVMPGDWEIKIYVLSGETVLFAGHILFDV